MEAVFNSARNDEDIDILVKWFNTGFVHDLKGNKLEDVEISKKHKFSLMERIWSSEKIPFEEKKQLLASLEKIDSSDWIVNTKKVCEAAHPGNKEKMWKQYFSEDKTGECEEWGLMHF